MPEAKIIYSHGLLGLFKREEFPVTKYTNFLARDGLTTRSVWITSFQDGANVVASHDHPYALFVGQWLEESSFDHAPLCLTKDPDGQIINQEHPDSFSLYLGPLVGRVKVAWEP